MPLFDMCLRQRGWQVALAAVALVACATPTPAPPPSVAPRVEPARPVQPADLPPPAPAVEPPRPAWTQPIAIPRFGEIPWEPAVPTATESPAVAARFLQPAVHYNTPAFEPGRTAFTSNEELQSLLRSFVRDGAAVPGATTVRLLPLGRSQAGAPIEALLFTRLDNPEAESLLRSGRPTVLLVGQQHGDEPAGSEALIVIAQELAQGVLSSLLNRINVVMLPRANPDGAQAGRRLTASGIDANRDHLLLRTPEAQAQAQLMRDYRPTVVVDAHEYTAIGRYLTKFGAVQRFDALVQYAMTANLPEFITKASEEWFRRPLLASLQREGLSTQWYYTTSADPQDKKMAMGGTRPDNGRNVNGLKNSISFLIETRGVGLGRAHLLRRVHTHVIAMASVLRSAADRADSLVKLHQFVDNEVSALACQSEAVLEAAPTPSEYVVVMLDPVTGADKPVAVTWDSSLELRPLKRRARPCGYWLAADQTDAVLRLRGLGVTVRQVAEAGVMRSETYREVSRETGLREDVRGSIADAGGVQRVEVALSPTLIDVPAGSFYVPMDQPLANLVLAALEPDTQSSYLANGIVTSVESVARVMLRPEAKLDVVP